MNYKSIIIASILPWVKIHTFVHVSPKIKIKNLKNTYFAFMNNHVHWFSLFHSRDFPWPLNDLCTSHAMCVICVLHALPWHNWWVYNNHWWVYDSKLRWAAGFNTLRPWQNGRLFPDDKFKCIFLNENVWIPKNNLTKICSWWFY